MDKIEFESLYTGKVELPIYEDCKNEIVLLEIWSSSLEEEPKFDDDAIVVEECGYETSLKETKPNKYFEVINHFSELVTEYDKYLARQNLGIAEKYSLTWGNIKGNILDLKDFITFLTERLDELKPKNEIPTIYYGPSTSNLAISESLTFTTEAYPSYIYILVPSDDVEFYVNGIQGGFIYQEEMYIDNIKFYVYRSFNSDLGATKITLKYGEISE